MLVDGFSYSVAAVRSDDDVADRRKAIRQAVGPNGQLIVPNP